MIKTKWITIGILIFLAACAVACRPSDPEKIIQTVVIEKEGKTIIETVVVTVEPTEEPTEEVFTSEQCCDSYRIAIYEEPVSLNYWNYLGPGSSIWTQYVVADDAAHLFVISETNFQFVPSLATDIPEPVQEEDGTWTITVEMVDDALWSDGEPITAHDVAFTWNTCKDLKLTWFWPNFCSPDDADIVVEPLDDFTLEYRFLDQAPNLHNWQFGAALLPVLPQHFWQDVVSEALSYVEDVGIPAAARPEGCNTSILDEGMRQLCQAWDAYDQAYTQAQKILYRADVTGQPVAGGYVFQEWKPGSYIRLKANENYYFKGAEITEYTDGTWRRVMPDGREMMFFGQAEGEETLRYSVGPYNPEVVYLIYGSPEAAFSALLAGEVDYVLNPIPIPRNLMERVSHSEGVKTFVNPDYDMFYLAFNLRKYPMSEYEFRQVFDIIMDRELIIDEILGGVVMPLYSTMHPDNTYWYNPDVPQPYRDLTHEERVETAVQVLKAAGWRWKTEPYWDDFAQDVVPGEGLTMPNGEPMPPLKILGPGPEFDIVRATFNQWISEWARELGMPVKSELTGRNAILDSVFVAADFDMYIFGTPLGNPANPIYYEEFWHSRYCTFETGGKNTACFKDDAYDALLEEFKATADLERARELVFQMQILLADQRPFIPLYSERVTDFASERVVFPYTDALGGIEWREGFKNSAQVLMVAP